jgi:hypothetical protein
MGLGGAWVGLVSWMELVVSARPIIWGWLLRRCWRVGKRHQRSAPVFFTHHCPPPALPDITELIN